LPKIVIKSVARRAHPLSARDFHTSQISSFFVLKMTASMPPETADWARPLYAGQIAMLGELAETGMVGARQVARLAKDAWCVDGVHTATLAHSRVARAVRLTLMLQARWIKALEDRDARRHTHPDDLADACLQDGRRETQARTIQIVERVAAREHDDADEVEGLVREAAERLDVDDDLLSLPVSEVVALICKDLGLDPDWPRLAQEAWAQEEMASGAPGWPLAGAAPAGSPANLIQGRFKPSG
jgi:hypothetical protein